MDTLIVCFNSADTLQNICQLYTLAGIVNTRQVQMTKPTETRALVQLVRDWATQLTDDNLYHDDLVMIVNNYGAELRIPLGQLGIITSILKRVQYHNTK